VWPLHHGAYFVLTHAHDQVRAHDPTTHPAVEQERKTAEHLPFGHTSLPIEASADSLGESFVVRHGSPRAQERSLNGFSSALGP
jgi:hypothetical protein